MNKFNVENQKDAFHENITACQSHVRKLVEELKKKISGGLLSSPIELDVSEDMLVLSHCERQLILIKNRVKKLKNKHGMI